MFQDEALDHGISLCAFANVFQCTGGLIAQCPSATTPTCLASIPLKTLTGILQNLLEKETKYNLLNDWLKINSVSKKGVYALSCEMKKRVSSNGTKVYVQGQQSKFVYFIKSGEIVLSRMMPQQCEEPNGAQEEFISRQELSNETSVGSPLLGSSPAMRELQQQTQLPSMQSQSVPTESLQISTIHAGMVFGQDEVLLDQVRQHTATITSTQLIVYELNKYSLMSFLQSMDNQHLRMEDSNPAESANTPKASSSSQKRGSITLLEQLRLQSIQKKRFYDQRLEQLLSLQLSQKQQYPQQGMVTSSPKHTAMQCESGYLKGYQSEFSKGQVSSPTGLTKAQRLTSAGRNIKIRVQTGAPGSPQSHSKSSKLIPPSQQDNVNENNLSIPRTKLSAFQSQSRQSNRLASRAQSDFKLTATQATTIAQPSESKDTTKIASRQVDLSSSSNKSSTQPRQNNSAMMLKVLSSQKQLEYLEKKVESNQAFLQSVAATKFGFENPLFKQTDTNRSNKLKLHYLKQIQPAKHAKSTSMHLNASQNSKEFMLKYVMNSVQTPQQIIPLAPDNNEKNQEYFSNNNTPRHSSTFQQKTFTPRASFINNSSNNNNNTILPFPGSSPRSSSFQLSTGFGDSPLIVNSLISTPKHTPKHSHHALLQISDSPLLLAEKRTSIYARNSVSTLVTQNNISQTEQTQGLECLETEIGQNTPNRQQFNRTQMNILQLNGSNKANNAQQIGMKTNLIINDGDDQKDYDHENLLAPCSNSLPINREKNISSFSDCVSPSPNQLSSPSFSPYELSISTPYSAKTHSSSLLHRRTHSSMNCTTTTPSNIPIISLSQFAMYNDKAAPSPNYTASDFSTTASPQHQTTFPLTFSHLVSLRSQFSRQSLSPSLLSSSNGGYLLQQAVQFPQYKQSYVQSSSEGYNPPNSPQAEVQFFKPKLIQRSKYCGLSAKNSKNSIKTNNTSTPKKSCWSNSVTMGQDKMNTLNSFDGSKNDINNISKPQQSLQLYQN